MVEQRPDVGATQQGVGLLMEQPLLQGKQHRHHHQRHMMMPAPPTAYLVISQPYVLFAMLQAPFNPVALPLHERQPRGWRVSRGVTEAILDLGWGVHFPANDHMPLPRLGFVTIPHPHPATEDI